MICEVIAVSGTVYLVLYYGCLVLGLVALVDSLRHRTDAYPAADRQTKQVWIAILAGGLLAQVLFPAFSLGILSIFGLAGIVASIVYLVDVRKRLVEVTRGPRW
jgi:hypothetical protein